MTKRTLQLLRAIALAAVLVVVVACGDDGDSTDAGSSDDATSTDTGSSDGGDTADGGDGGPSADAGTALVTFVTGEEFEFDQELVCLGMGGAMSGTFVNSEGVEVSIDVPPEDWETSTTDWDPPSLTLRDERDPQDWRIFEAGPDLATTHADAGGDRAVITDWSTDNGRVTGNGFVLDTYGVLRAGTEGTELPQPVAVFFAFECS